MPTINEVTFYSKRHTYLKKKNSVAKMKNLVVWRNRWKKKNYNNATLQEGAIFCTFNASIEERLQVLHSKMRTGVRKYQSEIDRYLIACISPELEHLIIPRGNSPHYDNLPDFSFYAISILDPSKDSIIDLQQIFLLLRQCTPLRRRTKRAQRELQWESYSLEGMHHLVISMQACETIRIAQWK